MKLLIFIASCFVATLGDSTKYYIGTYTNALAGVAENYPYPVDQCCSDGSTYLKFTCSGSSTMIESKYSNSACTTLLSTTNHTSTNSTGKGKGSFSCTGTAYYSKASIYTANTCSGTAFTTLHYAVNVCYETTDGNYGQATCSDNTARILTYAPTDTTCSGAANETETLTITTSCGKLFAISDFLTAYAKLDACYAPVDSAAYNLNNNLSLLVVLSLVILSYLM